MQPLISPSWVGEDNMIDPKQEFVLSIFNIYHRIDEHLIGIYNSLHDSMLLIEGSDLNDLSALEPDILDVLLKEKAAFPKSFDEKSYFRYFINKLKYSPTHVSFVVALTTDCNFCCPYCFEGSSLDAEYMGDEVADATIKFIFDSLQKHTSIRTVYIAFFGGEPLLNKPAMWKICRRLRETLSNTHDIRFTITTNLTLLTPDDIILFRDYGFTNVQVAIDGAKAIHDTRRATKDRQPTYDLTFKNIRYLVDGHIHTMVFLNFDHQNASTFKTLITDIRNNLPFHELVFLLNPITASLSRSCSKKYFMTPEVEAKLFADLLRELRDSGLTVQSFGQKDMLCIANSDVSCIIDPKGRLYKCGMMIGHDRYVTGTVFGDSFNSMYYQLIINEPWENCLQQSCPYLPICGGGCRSLALVKGRSLSEPYCERNNYFETVFPVVLEDEFNRLLRRGNDVM